MRKKKVIKRHPIKPDKKFNSVVVAQLINKVMKRGEKRIAMWIVYQAALTVEKKTSLPFLTVFESCLTNVKPSLETKSRKFGGSNRRIPIKVEERRASVLAFRWIVESAKEKKVSKSGKIVVKPMFEKLAEEIIDAHNKTGGAFKKKENIHKEAMSNMELAAPF